MDYIIYTLQKQDISPLFSFFVTKILYARSFFANTHSDIYMVQYFSSLYRVIYCPILYFKAYISDIYFFPESEK